MRPPIFPYPLYSQFFYLLKKNWLSILLTIILAGVATSLPAFFYLFSEQFTQLTGDPKEQQQFVVFLQPDITEADLQQAVLAIKNMEDWQVLNETNSDQALRKLEQLDGIKLSLDLEIMQSNPLYHTLELVPRRLLNNNQLNQLKQAILMVQFVSDVYVDEKWAVMMSQMLLATNQFLRFFGLVAAFIIGALMFYFALLKISNNKSEIALKIMLGAYPWQIYAPFAGFGFFLGFGSGLFAILLIGIIHMFYQNFWEQWEMHILINKTLIVPAELLTIMLLGSISVGVISALIATKVVCYRITNHNLK